MTEIFIPKTGMYESDVELVDWLIDEGAQVAEGQAICTLVTEKVEIEIVAPASGWLRQLAQPPITLPIGSIIGLIAPTVEDYENLVSTGLPSV